MSSDFKFNRKSHRLPGWDYRTPGSYYITICTQDKMIYFRDKNAENIAEKYWLEISDRHPHVELGEYDLVYNHLHGIITIKRYPDSYDGKKHPTDGIVWRDNNDVNNVNYIDGVDDSEGEISRGGVHTFHAKNVRTPPLPNDAYQPTPQHIQINNQNSNDTKQQPVNKQGIPATRYNLPGSIGAIIQGYKNISGRLIRYGTRFSEFAWQRDFWDHIIRDQKEYHKIVWYIKNNRRNWHKDRNNPRSSLFSKKDFKENARLEWNKT
jgi:REP element-mobilizing transposase RayT